MMSTRMQMAPPLAKKPHAPMTTMPRLKLPEDLSDVPCLGVWFHGCPEPFEGSRSHGGHTERPGEETPTVPRAIKRMPMRRRGGHEGLQGT